MVCKSELLFTVRAHEINVFLNLQLSFDAYVVPSAPLVYNLVSKLQAAVSLVALHQFVWLILHSSYLAVYQSLSSITKPSVLLAV